MSEIETLIKEYEKQVQLPWVKNLPPPQRVWFLIYDKMQERRLAATVASGRVSSSNTSCSPRMGAGRSNQCIC